MEPDIIVMGKAISSGLPLSAIVAKEEIVNATNPSVGTLLLLLTLFHIKLLL